MLATLGKDPFDDPAWIYEIKWDGYRAVAEIGKSTVNLYSRNGVSFTKKFAPIAEALTAFDTPMVLDGEVVVPDENGKADFQQLQHYDENPDIAIYYYVFDILELKGKSLRDKTVIERKEILRTLIPEDGIIKYCDHVEGTGKAFFKVAVENDLEGIIAKRADSKYYEGKRTPDWLKIKHQNTDEAIICGFTPPKGGRKYFGSLVLGIHDKNGELKHAGNVGTGFTDHTLKQLHDQLKKLETGQSPFKSKVAGLGPVTWVQPKLVCNIKFTEWTSATSFRHPVFLGLREDLDASQIKRPTAMTKKEAEKKSTEKPTKTKAEPKEKTVATKKATTPKKSGAAKKQEEGDVQRTIGGKKVELSNLNKVYWPDEGITKGDVIDYYESISKWILPYLKDRPESLRRNPNGIKDEGFFHKDAGENAPDWVETFIVHSESGNKDIDYIVCNNLPTLLYMNNLGCIEINPWFSTTKKQENPTYMVMDLDPSDNNTFEDVITTALVVKEILDSAGAACYCKTSGASGLHIYVPLGNKYTYEQSKQFGEIIAQLTVDRLPELTTILRPLNQRKGRLYVDFLQNRRGQTLACAYSLRPKAGGTVSTPLEWDEVKRGLHPSQFTMFNIKERVEKKGDLFKAVLGKGIDLEKCLEKLIG
ncbi:MAG: DNA ligase D [Bacteroidota bacterium]